MAKAEGNTHTIAEVIPEFFNKIIRSYETGDKQEMKELLNRRQNAMELDFAREV